LAFRAEADDERQLAVIAGTENRQASGEGLYCVAIPHIDRQIVLSNQQASGRVDMKGAWVYLLGLDVLDWRRLAAPENRDQPRPPPSDLKGEPQGASLNGRTG
jgi:hypothetical protein